jgi:hypothetical protein
MIQLRENFRERFICVAAGAALMLAAATAAFAANVQLAGKITVAPDAPLAAVCTDPVIQNVLNEDFHGAHRDFGAGTPVTITVTIRDKLLKPGVVLGDLGPGDPWELTNLLRKAGTEPPPVGDTGTAMLDPYSASVEHQVRQPDDPMQGFRNYQAMRNAFNTPQGPRFGPHGNAGDEQIYDRVIVARASSSGSTDRMTVVAVIHPGDSVRTAKELLAEEIANAILK